MHATTLPHFQNPALLETALTHRSALNERTMLSRESNERLEFLGDAVLELITTTHLYSTFPDESEGVLTAYRSALVKTTNLAAVATKLGLGQQIKMSKGEEQSGGRENVSLLADTFEAIIGALYLDQGIDIVEMFLQKHLLSELDQIVAEKRYKDPKSELQEQVQAAGFAAPTYTVEKEFGPDHDKEFTVSVAIGNAIVASGVGKSKQQAQQAAAEVALQNFTSSTQVLEE